MAPQAQASGPNTKISAGWIARLDVSYADSLVEWRNILLPLADRGVVGIAISAVDATRPLFASPRTRQLLRHRATRATQAFEAMCEAALEMDLRITTYVPLLNAGPQEGSPFARIWSTRTHRMLLRDKKGTPLTTPEKPACVWLDPRCPDVITYASGLISDLVERFPVDAVVLKSALVPPTLLGQARPWVRRADFTLNLTVRDEAEETASEQEPAATADDADFVRFYRTVRAASQRGVNPVPLLLEADDWLTLSDSHADLWTLFDGVVGGADRARSLVQGGGIPDVAQMWIELPADADPSEFAEYRAIADEVGALWIMAHPDTIPNELTSRGEPEEPVAWGDEPQRAFEISNSCARWLCQVASIPPDNVEAQLAILFDPQQTQGARIAAQESIVRMLRSLIATLGITHSSSPAYASAMRLLRIIGSYRIVPPVAHALDPQA